MEVLKHNLELQPRFIPTSKSFPLLIEHKLWANQDTFPVTPKWQTIDFGNHIYLKEKIGMPISESAPVGITLEISSKWRNLVQ